MFWGEFVVGTLTSQQGAGEGRVRLFVSLQATTTSCANTNLYKFGILRLL